MLYQMQQENAAKAAAEAQLQQTDPRAYNAQKAQSLADELFSTFTTNGHVFGGRPNMEAENTAALEEIKKVDPNAYYNAQLSLDLRKAGWDAGQNKTNDITNARIQENINNAMGAGISTDQIKNLVANNYANTAQWHATNIAQRQGQGATLQGIEKVAPAFAAMITAGALAPAAGALEAGSVAASVAPEIAGGGFYTGAGFGAEGLGTAAGSTLAEGSTVASLPTSTGTYGSFTAPALGAQPTGIGLTGAIPEGVMVGNGTLGTTIGATYAAAAPGQFALDALGNAIPASSIGIGGFAPSGTSFADILKTANQVRQGIGTVNTLSKLLGGGAAGGATGGAKTGGTATGTTGGLSPQDLAKYLGSPTPVQAGAVPYQIKMNQNPFTFNTPGQTQATKGMYDVSGINPMANALRKL
jgi:hypothetical protein